MASSRLPQFALPGAWGRIDLATPESTKTTVHALVERQIGRADERASLRADIRKRILTVAEPARENGAVEFHLASEIVPGVPFGASLALFLPAIDLTLLQGLGLASLVDVLEGVTAGSAVDSGDRHQVSTDEIRAVRHVYRKTVPATEDIPEHLVLQVDYWVAAAAPARLATMSFSTMHTAHEALLLQLFDAIVATVRWPAPVSADAGR